jgi:hypothetical protein
MSTRDGKSVAQNALPAVLIHIHCPQRAERISKRLQRTCVLALLTPTPPFYLGQATKLRTRLQRRGWTWKLWGLVFRTAAGVCGCVSRCSRARRLVGPEAKHKAGSSLQGECGLQITGCKAVSEIRAA